MKRLLLRTPKDAFEVVSPESTLAQNLVGGNSGNLIFTEAAQRILSAREVEITPDRFEAHKLGAGHINERFDAYVIPLANAFRPSFETGLRRLTGVLERLTIPVVVLGVGAQANASYDAARLRSMEPSIRAFMSAVLDRSPSVGVRGEFTHDYLRGLGYRDVEVIGCPSMFLGGDRLRVEKRVPTLARDAIVSINVSPYVTAMGGVVASHLERYPNLRYIAQDVDTLERLLWGDRTPVADDAGTMPVHTTHPLFQQRKVRYYVDPWPWIDDLRAAEFSFGTRIHGNIAALVAGTPAVVLAHDSRTLELARYFDIPHRLVSELPPDVDARDLYESADFAALIDGHAARFGTFTGFLARHGLRHVFEPGEDPAAFDAQLAGTEFPAAVGYTGVARLGRVRREGRRAAGRLRREARCRGLIRG
jgi:Polysaccharide pyruvyl transferase